MKNKGLMITLIVLVVITLVAVVGVVLFLNFTKDSGATKEKEPTVDEIVEQTVELDEIVTNLANRQFIRITLAIQTDSKKAAEELTKRKFQVNNKVIQELSDMKPEDFEGKAGKIQFEESVKAQISPLMQEGEITKVYIVSQIIQ